MALAEDWAVQPPPESYEELRFGQDMALKPFLLLSLKNGLLNLVTLTLYRFWGRTEVRHRLWARVSLNDEPFEYTGRGIELFLGFLIALGTVGVPFLALVFAIQFLPPTLLVPLILFLYLGMFVLLGAAISLAFRYMASRTIWRGIRFRATGPALDFGVNYAGYLMLSAVTLGWYGPAMKMRVAEKLWANLRFGNLKLRWLEDQKEGLYSRFALGWFGAIGAYLLLIGGIVGAGMAMGGGLAEDALPGVGFIVAMYVMLLVFGLVVMVLFAPYQAAVLRKIVGSLRLSEASFKLELKAIDMAWLSLSNIALLVISLGLLSPYVQARTARFLIKRLSSTGMAPLSWARQTSAGPKQGEGLADAFGFSPI
jgi:uncharacterized membrane protein YjgN (DUF898 family)